jgi:hypothetical protein
LGLQRGLTAPEEVYFSWEGKYSPEDQKLILVYTNVSGSLYQELKNTKLANHRLLLEIIPTMQDQEIYVFDFSSYASDWDHLIAGRYSKMSLKTKQTVLDYFERYSGNYIYMHSFLFPNKWFKRYAEILDVPEDLLVEVGELCDKPDWDKELLRVHTPLPVTEMERSRIRENQREGIELAKLRGVYKGRVNGSKEDIRKFLSKPKIEKTIEYLEKGYKASEISKIVGVHVNTITKVKKVVNIN